MGKADSIIQMDSPVMAKHRLPKGVPLADVTNIGSRAVTEGSSSLSNSWLVLSPEDAQEGVNATFAAYLGAAIGLQRDHAPFVSNPAADMSATPARSVMLQVCKTLQCKCV